MLSRFDIDEKMALPILLRGLGQSVDWINLKHAPINNGTVTEVLQNPEVCKTCFFNRIPDENISCLNPISGFVVPKRRR